MNILMLIDGLSPGGAETHLVTLCRALLARGHRVAVFSGGGALEAELRAAGVSCHRALADLRGRRFLFGIFPCLRQLRRLMRAGHYDVLHAHTRRTALLLRLLGGGCGRLVAGAEDYAPAARRRLARPLRVVSCHARFSRRFRGLSYWGECAIAVSEDLKRHLIRTFGVPAAGISVIPNGVDLARFHPLPRGEGKTLTILFASRLDADCSRGAELLLPLFPGLRRRAAAAGVTLRLCIAGGGDRLGELSALAATLGTRGIELTGALPDLSSLMAGADVFVGVSRAALEAIACEIPVILAGNEGFGGAVTPENFDRLAKENFCARSCPPLTAAALERALNAWLDARLQGEPSSGTAALRARLLDGWDDQSMAAATEDCYRRGLQKRRAVRVLVAGYAGCGNLGDDAILRRIVALRHQKPAPARPWVLTDPLPPPSEAAPLLLLCATTGGAAKLALPTVPRARPLALLRALWQADALWLGGGGLLQNCSPHGNRSLLYYLALARGAQLLRRPTFLVAGGVGPLRGRLASRAVGRVLRRARGLSVRDAASQRLLISLGIPPRRIVPVPDPVAALSPRDLSVKDRLAARRRLCELLGTLPPKEKLLAVVPRAGDEPLLASLQEVLTQWRARGGALLFLPLDRIRDRSLCRRLAGACGGAVCQAAEEKELLALLCRAGGVISGRLHGLILARGARIPTLGYSPMPEDGKVREFCSTHDIPHLPLHSSTQEIRLAMTTLGLLDHPEVPKEKEKGA